MQKLIGDEGGWEGVLVFSLLLTASERLVSINEHSASPHIIEHASVLQRAPDL